MTDQSTLRHHAKTFFWAWVFLPRNRRDDIARLYAFCRRVDDIADEGGDPLELAALRTAVAEGRAVEVAGLEAQGVRREWLLDLIDGALSDVEFGGIADERALDVYCYRVAGVVGLMMCPLLGVAEPAALQHAVDLGSAMQLTNIARDVAEDLERGRVYVPRTWGDARSPGVVEKLLTKAEGLYRSGNNGLRFIPVRTRLSIKLARALYRDIGYQLSRRDFDPFRGRAYVPWWRKLWLTARTLLWGSGETDVGLIHNRVWLELGTNHGGESRVLDPA